MAITTEQVLYTGRVQGVGFRWTTESIARKFRVTGFVRNLESGQVELVAQGEIGEVEGLIEAVCDRFRDNIEATDRKKLPEKAEFSDFRIQR